MDDGKVSNCSVDELLEIVKSLVCIAAQKQSQIYKLRDHIQIISNKLGAVNKNADLLKDKNVSLQDLTEVYRKIIKHNQLKEDSPPKSNVYLGSSSHFQSPDVRSSTNTGLNLNIPVWSPGAVHPKRLFKSTKA